MKLASYQSNGQIRVGVVRENQILDISHQYPTVVNLIEAGTVALEQLKDWTEHASGWLELDESTLVAPIPNPRRNVFCVGWNYLKHYDEGVGKRKELERELPEYPSFFTKSTMSINGPFGDIRHNSDFSVNLDYEGELAVVVGKEGRDIPESNAVDYIFGYTAANDVSARDIQRRHGGQWFKGKSLDTCAPIGPWIVTKDEIPDVQNLNIECKLNGELMQSSNTKHMIFSVARLISELSKGMTLLPGDIFLTGTPDGVGWMRTPPVFLGGGDIVSVIVEGIGAISNHVVIV